MEEFRKVWKQCGKYSGSIHAITQLSIEAYNKLLNDLYILLIDKCTNNQVATIEHEDQDGFFAYFNLCRMHTQTAGLGSLERRDFIMHPDQCDVAVRAAAGGNSPPGRRKEDLLRPSMDWDRRREWMRRASAE